MAMNLVVFLVGAVILGAILGWAKYDAQIRAPRQTRDELRKLDDRNRR